MKKSESPGSTPGSRRERLRETTLREIKECACRHLVNAGPAGVSLRAIARDMGMTAPALYRYFDSHEALITELIADFYRQLAQHLDAARQAAGTEPSRQMLATSRSFRQWSHDRPAEFGLLFGAPLPGYQAPPDGPTDEAGNQFAQVWLTMFVALWNERPFPPRRRAYPPPEAYVAQLEAYSSALGGVMPAHAVEAFLECWARLYGQICLEAFGHLHFALSDPEPMFESMLMELAERLGFDYTP